MCSQKNSTRDKIVDIAIDLFSRKGYAETSVRDIANDVGIKSSSLYYHFESKEAILDYILEQYAEVVRIGSHKDSWNEIRQMLRQGQLRLSAKDIMNLLFFSFDSEHNDQYRKIVKIIYSEQIRNEKVRNYYQHEYIIEYIRYIKSVLYDLMETGNLPKCDPTKFTGILYSITLAFTSLSCIDIDYIDEDNENTGMFDLLEYALHLLMKD